MYIYIFNSNLKMVQFIKVNGKIIKEMEKVNNIGLMDQYMRDNGLMIRLMAMVD